MVDGDLLAKIGDGGYALGARAHQIRDDLMALEKATPKDLLAIQLDDRAVFLTPLAGSPAQDPDAGSRGGAWRTGRAAAAGDHDLDGGTPRSARWPTGRCAPSAARCATASSTF